MKKIVLCLFINVLFFSQCVLASGLEDVIEFVQPLGTIYDNYIFYIKNHELTACDIDGTKHYSLH